MIIEFLQSLMSDAPKWAKQQNLVKESIAIGARYRRHSRAWSSHLLKCQSEIEKFISENPKAKRIAIFGSGHLLDIPKDLLNQSGFEFFLFDAVHPRSVTKSLYKAKCHFIFCDLSQSPEQIFKSHDDIFKSCDLFISLNLLSQLALSGVSASLLSPEERAKLAREIISNHLSFFRALGGPHLLFTDFEKRFLNTADEVIESESSIWNYDLGPAVDTWLWDLAPIGEVSPDFRIELRVGLWK